MVACSKKDSSIVLSLLLAGAVVSVLVSGVESFSPSSPATRTSSISTSTSFARKRCFLPSSAINGRFTLFASKSEGGKKKRRRRKRKKDDDTPAKPEAPKVAATTIATPPPSTADASPVSDEKQIERIAVDDDGNEFDVADIKSVADFSFKGKIVDSPVKESQSVAQDVDGSIPLPDIKDTLRRKKMGSAAEKGPMDDNMPKTKIDRKDRKALMKLLEQDPYADGDDSFFIEQDYTQISAWLGEGTKPFLGIPTGPLQVGHTIGALVIVLMAFVEYPGFPLTNLPSPLRGALQGGLGTIYGINALLTIVAFFKARERDQPAALWMSKTLTVGGLALDQLSQLPTTKEIEAAKARKGKRSLANRRK